MSDKILVILHVIAAAAAMTFFGYMAAAAADAPKKFRGVAVAPESRCSEYDRSDYRYPQSLEPKIVERLGGIWSPYTNECFASIKETDIEHVVSISEAHDSGLCAADGTVRSAFASDMMNLTLASPGLNRYEKSGKDAGEWLPDENQCFFINRTMKVKRKYGLSMDEKELAAVKSVRKRCRASGIGNSARLVNPCPAEAHLPDDGEDGALDLYDDNGNGAITCSEARRHGIAPVYRGHRAYQYMRDGNEDGVVCR